MLVRLFLPALMLFAVPATAAPIPEPIEAMLRAAGSGDRATVAKVARKAAPGSAAEINALVAALNAKDEADRRAAVAAQGLFDGWTGEGAVGGSYSTGNTEEIGASASLALEKRGLDWEHDLNASFDYQRTQGTTRRERFFAGYAGKYDIGGDLFFAFGLLSYERDRFSGIERRFTESLGAGYRIADGERFTWSVEGGPALRQTRFSDGRNENDVNFLGRTELAWRPTRTLKLTEIAGFVIGGDNSSYYSKSAATATILGDLSARLSLDILHETKPPEGREKTDTITRASLVYGF